MNCQYCNKICKSNISKSAHERFCKLNPKYQQNIKKHKQTTIKAMLVASSKAVKEKAKNNLLNEIKIYTFNCSKCGKQYQLNLKVRDFNKGAYPKTCSSFCAHSRQHSEETKEKIRNSINKILVKLQEHKIKNNFIHICSNCGKQFEHKTLKKSLLCDDCFFKTHKRNAINDNTRSKRHVTGEFHKTQCAHCKKIIYTKHLGNTYCYQCADKFNLYHFMLYDQNGKKLTSDTTKKKLSQNTKKLMAEGKIKPWQSRNILSYPQKFFIKVLSFNHIEYKPNKPEHGYFLDFVINTPSGLIDLQIDGRQHEFRKQHDKKRDEIISSIGYYVYRIKWNCINNQKGKDLMKQKITNFLNFYNSLL